MATAAFKSTTKRTPIGASSASSTDDSSSSNRNYSAYRRARSLSRAPRRVPSHDLANDPDEFPAPRGKFVNTVRGSGFPEISLDDLAIEFFESANRGRMASRHSELSPANGATASRSRMASRHSELSPANGATVSQRRGRSVSRKSSGVINDGRGNSDYGANRDGGSDAHTGRRRSLSVVRYQISDSESDPDHSRNSKSRVNLRSIDVANKPIHKTVASDQTPVLRRSLSQKDMRSYDGYSSQSSVLTDEEGAGAHLSQNATENIQTIYAQKKAANSGMDGGFHKATQKELRHSVDVIKTKNEKVGLKPRTSTLATVDRLLSNNSDVLHSVSCIRMNYETELEQSEKRKQDLLAEIVLEEQRGRELSKIVKELLPDKKNEAIQKPSRARKRSNDRNRMSKRLTEEAERYIEDFISNVEDTDISSLDGERSDTSSSIGGLIKPESFNSPSIPRSLPVEMDGVMFPWLQWETSNDASPTTNLNKTRTPVTPKIASFIQEIKKVRDQSNRSVSSHGSWSPDGIVEYSSSKFGESYESQTLSTASSKGMNYDMDEYLELKKSEDLLIERWRQRQRMDSGSLLLCNLRLF
ncbi:uncharacterized protein LOC114723154 isoform X2 [Neltuma alba]|uniref:uncharacterized protein LOC114723154 isoform X2 n=1 Tax=Neltuma alba TaxID=207710 RepID=UPI0010A5A170|nr:uncharacterized protein LOC114723154 isoform X2 [Prosopis alba]